MPLFPNKQLQGNGPSTNVSFKMHSITGEADALRLRLCDLEGDTKLEAVGVGLSVTETDCVLVKEVLREPENEVVVGVEGKTL